MSNERKYQYLSLILGVVAIVFAILFFTKESDMKVSDILGTIDNDLESCRQRIAQWQTTNITPETEQISQEAQKELNDLLADCKDTLKEHQNRI